MNIFRNLLGKVWQDPNAAEVVKISQGQLHLVRPGNIRTPRECLYNEAMATIRRIPNFDHQFNLVVTRVFEDGDQELLEDDDENEQEKAFLIGEELEFRCSKREGEPTLVWRDIRGDIDELYEFVATGTNEVTIAFFETCMYRAMYERRYKVSADNVNDNALEEFTWISPTGKKMKVKSEPDLEKTKKGRSKAASHKTAVESKILINVFTCGAELHLWNPKMKEFSLQGTVLARIVKADNERFNYFLVASTDEGDIFGDNINSEMNVEWSSGMKSLTWNSFSGVDGSLRWLLRFSNSEDYVAFKNAYQIASWEGLNAKTWSDAKDDEQSYYFSSWAEDVEMLDLNSDEDEDEVKAGLDPEDESDDEPLVEEEDLPPALARGERNSQLTVGYKGDRSYVVRGNNIGVFRHDAENQLKYQATIGNLATPRGKGFRPKQLMLHDQDTKMILMNPSEPNSLYSMDIELGKVVEEWKIHDQITTDHIAPNSKFAQTTREQTVVGASHNALFLIDPRISGTKMVQTQYKQYSGKNGFSGLTTTAKGGVAVASEKGEIKLFDTLGKNAKTALPPLGDPIIGIDVTADGQWIIATTKSYLLLIHTLIGDGRYAGSLGFDRSFPAAAKPIPIRLQLRSDHVAYMNHSVSFTPARFNQGEGQTENAIVTSTGAYVVAWDFDKVKKGQIDKYEIKKYNDIVVQDNFKFGDDKEIVVALQNNVVAVNKKKLQRPTRKSLGNGEVGIVAKYDD